MKNLVIILVLTLTSHFSSGQACGIYRIRYVGALTSGTHSLLSIQLPATFYLHRFENEKSELSFVSTKLIDGKFNLELKSHLTTPYSDKKALIEFYKSKSRSLKIGVTVLDNGIKKDIFLEVKWEDILVSIIEDEKFGTLFEFRLKEIAI